MTENTSLDLAAPQQLNQAINDLPGSENLTPAEQTQIQNIVEEININDPVFSLAFGAKTMNSISQFSESLMQEVRAKDAGVIGAQLTDLLMKIKQVDISAFEQKPGFLASLPLLGSLFNRIERTMLEYQTLAKQVDTITEKLNEAMVDLLRNISVLEILFDRNRDVFQQITLHIIAGKQKLEQIKQNELPALQAQAATDPMNAQRLRDLLEGIQRFERRLHDLMLSRTIAMQSAPQIRLMQSNSQSLAEKIQSSILSTIPVWKSQIALSMSLQTQRQAAKLQKDVADTTNDLLRRNAEMLQTGTLETAREVERSVVDIETLREVQTRLLSTIEDSVKIAIDARQRRAEVEKELVTMENDLRSRLASIANGAVRQQ
ncbi:Tellurite resistance protein [Kosakonia radicincitans]|uniref:toxic anion resistance protein n=1 Tax=Kosakonia TaxID=1330547 RepID=UPI0009040581|nr:MULTISPECIES: toxic anion resistance protein [Kosakonia]APG20256.1 Tellurite resistance protein [Kosakonia radicincitans]NCF06126.1 toxic anion resistance protein [Kosakonia sp. MH5]